MSSRAKNPLWTGLGQLLHQPSGVLGLSIVLVMTAVALYAVFALPSNQSGSDWSATGLHSGWYTNPRNALPAWINLFRKDKLPGTIALDSRKGEARKTTRALSTEAIVSTLTYTFDYSYDDTPQEFVIYLFSQANRKQPLVKAAWLTPDGREIDLGTIIPASGGTVFYLGQDERLQRRFHGQTVMQALFVDPAAGGSKTLKGRYRLQVTAYLFEPGSDLEAEAVLYGKVHGLAGTDDLRRDLVLPLLLGTPVALAFGLLGAIATSLLSMFLAAVGVWFGGWVDTLVQRFSEITMTIPTLAVAIMVFLMYSHSVWAVLGVIVLLSIFGSALKNFRAVFLQAKEAPYVEAAQAQGAGDLRIIWKYLLPRIYPVMIPQLVIMVPVYVYYEVTLAFLGVSDPTLPTWGRIIFDALQNQAFQFHPHRILMPVALLVVTGLGFALLGLALDRILNPRLRD